MSVMTDTVLDFVKTAKHPTLMIIGVVVIVCLGELLFWLETSSKDIKFWGFGTTVPRATESKRAVRFRLHSTRRRSDWRVNGRLPIGVSKATKPLSTHLLNCN